MRISDWSSDVCSSDLRTAAARLAGLYALQGRPRGPQLVLTTLNALTQRTLTPFRVRQLVAKLAPKERIAISRLADMLQANGYEIGRASCRERVWQYC